MYLSGGVDPGGGATMADPHPGQRPNVGAEKGEVPCERPKSERTIFYWMRKKRAGFLLLMHTNRAPDHGTVWGKKSRPPSPPIIYLVNFKLIFLHGLSTDV